MNTSNGSYPRRRRPRIDAARRTQLLAAFDRSGLSVANFARRQGIHYTTFYGWRRRRAQAKATPAFVQVELPEPTSPVELQVELGARVRLRLTAEGQIPLAVRLLQAFNASRPC
jgi:transposase-like protein